MSMNTDPDVVADGLRAWVRGIYPLEAGVELLIRSCGGRFASSGMRWVQPGEDPGWWRVDVDQRSADNFAALSGGETRILRIAAALLGGTPVNLYEAIPGLDRDHAQLHLAHRRPDVGTARSVHDRDRHPQHAADRACGGPNRLLHRDG